MKRIKKIIFVILSILLGLVLIFNVYNFISIKVLHKDLATINGYAILEVVSGSMEPTIHKGDMIIINTKAKNYKENDIITFRGKEGEFVTHRIKSIDDKIMVTKGDNNDSDDDATTTSAIVGKYVTKISGAGRVLSSFKNPFAMIMIFIIGLLGCILLSTDSDGNPILEQDEKKFQDFLKEKNEKLEKAKNENKETEVKKVVKKEEKSKKNIDKSPDKPKKIANSTSKKDTTKEKTNKKSSTEKKNDVKQANAKKEAAKKSTTKKNATNKTSTTKPITKKATSKTAAAKNTKKAVATKNGKK